MYAQSLRNANASSPFTVVDVPGVEFLSLFDPCVSQGSKAYASVTGKKQASIE